MLLNINRKFSMEKLKSYPYILCRKVSLITVRRGKFQVVVRVWSRSSCICGILYFKLNAIDVINKITKLVFIIWSIYKCISQMIRYSRACGSYQDFVDKGKLLNQGFLLVKLKSSPRKFYGRYHDMVNRYGISVSQMTTDMFHLL